MLIRCGLLTLTSVLHRLLSGHHEVCNILNFRLFLGPGKGKEASLCAELSSRLHVEASALLHPLPHQLGIKVELMLFRKSS